MAMPSPATVAALIVSDLGIVPAGATFATAQWTAILTRIQTMISAGTVSVSTTTNVTTPQLATVISAAPGSPVTGTITGAAGTGTGTLT